MMLEKVISGGQTGVDQMALLVARKYGFQTGGTAPKGYRTETGPNFLLRDLYGLKESESYNYRNRTIDNIRESDATVWFGVTTSAGGILTLNTARHECDRRRYYCSINPSIEDFRQLLLAPIRILNVAGNRLQTHPEASVLAAEILEAVLWRRGQAEDV